MSRNPDNPSTTFFWNDWDNEPGMKFCELAAQGLWVKMLSLAARSHEYGVVLIGDHPSLRKDLPALLAASCGETAEAIGKLVDDLITFKVASVDDRGRVFNRRMVAEAELSAARSEAGRKGADVTNGKRQRSGKGVGKRGSKVHGKLGGKLPVGGSTVNDGHETNISTPADGGSQQNVGNAAAKTAPSSFSSLSSVSEDTGAAAPADSSKALDPAKLIFSQGLAWLQQTTGKSQVACRKLLGKWRKDFGSDEARIVALGRAQREGVEHPESWMTAASQARPANRSASPRAAWAEHLP
jgi:hypothetical protein